MNPVNIVMMGEFSSKRIFVKVFIAILAVTLVDLVYLNWWIFENKKTANSKTSPGQAIDEQRSISINSILDTVSSETSQASESKDVAKEEQPIEIAKQSTTIIQTAQKEIYVPVGSAKTNKGDYADLDGLAVSIDKDKYPDIDSVYFEASIWVENGNGKMYAQLYNATDKHPVWFSEISTSSSSGVVTTSSKITLDSGSKTYKIQAKTNLEEFAAHVDNARIKVVLK